MKFWYQSMTRQTEWGGYPAILRGILDATKDPGTEIHVAGITEIGGGGGQEQIGRGHGWNPGNQVSRMAHFSWKKKKILNR